MAVLLLAPSNIEQVKLSMRDAFPQVRASHRAEALASALGFQTHASLLALMRYSTETAVARVIELARFSARTSQLGYDHCDPKPLIQIIRSPALPLRPWAEFRRGDSQVNNRWFYECQRRNIPLITVETRAKYTTLNWDCISRDPKYDTHLGEDEGAHLVRRMFAVFQSLVRHSPGKAMFKGSSFVGSVDNLLPDVAKNLADAFYMLLTTPVADDIAA